MATSEDQLRRVFSVEVVEALRDLIDERTDEKLSEALEIIREPEPEEVAA